MEVRVIFLRIGPIDTAKEIFKAEIFLQSKWFEPRLDNLSEQVSVLKFRQSTIEVRTSDWTVPSNEIPPPGQFGPFCPVRNI